MGKKLSAAASKKSPGKRPAKKKSNGGPGRGHLATLGGVVDLLAEMESVLADPDQKTKNPIRHNYLRMLRKDLPEFTRQYNELLKSKRPPGSTAGNGRGVCDTAPGPNELQSGVPASADATQAISEEELRIEEAIERVVEELTAARKRVESGSG